MTETIYDLHIHSIGGWGWRIVLPTIWEWSNMLFRDFIGCFKPWAIDHGAAQLDTQSHLQLHLHLFLRLFCVGVTPRSPLGLLPSCMAHWVIDRTPPEGSDKPTHILVSPLSVLLQTQSHRADIVSGSREHEFLFQEVPKQRVRDLGSVCGSVCGTTAGLC